MAYKQILVSGLGTVAAAAFGYVFSGFALTNNYASLIVSIAIGILYLILFSLRMLLVGKKQWAALGIAADLTVFTAAFLENISFWLIVSSLIVALWLFYAWQQGRASLNNMLTIRFSGMRYGFFTSSFRAVLFLGIAAYLSFVTLNAGSVPRGAIASFFTAIPTLTNTSFFQNIAGGPVPPEAFVTASNRIIDGVHAAINSFLGALPPHLQKTLLAGLGIVLFLMVNVATGFITPLISACAWGIFQLLLKTGFITIKIEKRDKEIIAA